MYSLSDALVLLKLQQRVGPYIPVVFRVENLLNRLDKDRLLKEGLKPLLFLICYIPLLIFMRFELGQLLLSVGSALVS
jgi:hypothetical protein